MFEQTRQGLGGWIDDEIANTSPWGFDVEAISRPTSIWYDPNDTTLPHQHGEWLAAHIQGAELVVTHALGHGSPGGSLCGLASSVLVAHRLSSIIAFDLQTRDDARPAVGQIEHAFWRARQVSDTR
jgi:hypothetical protein